MEKTPAGPRHLVIARLAEVRSLTRPQDLGLRQCSGISPELLDDPDELVGFVALGACAPPCARSIMRGVEPRERDVKPYRYWLPPGREVGQLLYSMPDGELLAVARDLASEPWRRAADEAVRAWPKIDRASMSWISELAALQCFQRGLVDLQEFCERAPGIVTPHARTLPGSLRVDDIA